MTPSPIKPSGQDILQRDKYVRGQVCRCTIPSVVEILSGQLRGTQDDDPLLHVLSAKQYPDCGPCNS